MLWVGERGPPSCEVVAAPSVRRHLGRSFDAVVLDLHTDVHADQLGMVHGFVWGGGALVLRLPPAGDAPTELARRLTIEPFPVSQVGDRFWRRFERRLAASALVETWAPGEGPPAPLGPAEHAEAGTPDQVALVELLVDAWREPVGAAIAVLADRGRGKSSALGLAVARARQRDPALRVLVVAPSDEAVSEVLRFGGALPVLDPVGAARDQRPWDVVLVDEAAQIPVPTLRRIAEAHPRAHLTFATTARGYEGTGRGFVLRFLRWLEAGPGLRLHRLEAPIRWSAGDPLEALTFDLLALDAEPAALGDVPTSNVAPASASQLPADVVHRVLDRDALATDEPLLRALFGLLVHAHYRTTPSDLRRLLDGPNLTVHALITDEQPVAVCLLAEEGRLPPATVDALVAGQRRLRGQALAETLVRHSGRRDAGAMRLVRSMRTAVHPDLRGRGLGALLVERIHDSLAPDVDAIGTLFGATPELLRFRRRSGYLPVRLGSSRSGRAGEPSVVMVRPLSERARALVADLRVSLARDLPVLTTLAEREGTPLVPALLDALRHDLPAAPPLSDAQRIDLVDAYVDRGGTHETSAVALKEYVDARKELLPRVTSEERALIAARVLGLQGWDAVASAAGLSGPRVAMRALRRALRSFRAAARTSSGVHSAT